MFSGSESFPGRYRTVSHQGVLRAGLRPIPALDLLLVQPFFHIRNRGAGLPDRTLLGQGDLTILADWYPWRGEEDAPASDFAGGIFSLEGLSFRGGFKLPTGRAENDLDLGRGPATLLQLGTGTLDALLGVHFTGRAEDFTIFLRADVQVALHENRFGFRPAEVFTTATGFSYTFVDRVSAGIALSTLHFTKDRFDGEVHPDTGSHFWFLTPSVSVKVSEGIALHTSVRVPVIRRSKNPSTGDLFSIGLSWSIEF